MSKNSILDTFNFELIQRPVVYQAFFMSMAPTPGAVKILPGTPPGFEVAIEKLAISQIFELLD